MNKYNNPGWWSNDDDSAWDRVKAALRRDWDQTKHDFGGDEPETNQSVGHTVKQAGGKEGIPPRGQPAYEEYEPAHRFGYGAYAHYGGDYDEWDDELEARLKSDWEATYPARKQYWSQDRDGIRYAWDYGADNLDKVDTK